MKTHWTKLAAFGIAFLMLLSLFSPAATRVRAEGEDEAVENVKTLLEGIDSLAEMQYYRVTVTREAGLTSGYRYYDNPNYTQAHLDAQAAYRDYLDDMFAKRAAAKEAYEALTDEQKAAIAADETAAANLAKLTPYDKLPTKIPLLKEDLIVDTIKGDQLDYPVAVDPVTDESDPYIYEYLRGYELSFSFADEAWPSNLVMVDASKGNTGWTPDGVY